MKYKKGNKKGNKIVKVIRNISLITFCSYIFLICGFTQVKENEIKQLVNDETANIDVKYQKISSKNTSNTRLNAYKIIKETKISRIATIEEPKFVDILMANTSIDRIIYLVNEVDIITDEEVCNLFENNFFKNSRVPSITYEEFEYLKKLFRCEYEYDERISSLPECTIQWKAIISTVINRLDMQLCFHANTLEEVLNAEKQYEVIYDEKVNREPLELMNKAVVLALFGDDPTAGAVYYNNPSISGKFESYAIEGVEIGEHVFYFAKNDPDLEQKIQNICY